MKKYLSKYTLIKLFFVFYFFSLSTFAQNSYEFGVTLPVEAPDIFTVDSKFYGLYESEKGPQITYEITDKGIFIKTINIQAISKETMRESSQYFVRNEHIFGVTEDSIPYVFEDEKYYFGVRNTVQLIGKDTENKLTDLNQWSYILNFKTEDGYIPSLLEFNGNHLLISSFDYDEEGKVFKKVQEQQKRERQDNNLTVIVLIPTVKEWQKLSKKEIFGTQRVFIKK